MATITPVRLGSGDFLQLSRSGSGASFLDFLMLGAGGSNSTADLSLWLDTRRYTEMGFQLFRPDFNVDLTDVVVVLEGTNIVDPGAADPDISTPAVTIGTLNAINTYVATIESFRFIRVRLTGLPPDPAPLPQIFVNIALFARAR